MSQISNDAEFKQALQGLDATQQRITAGLFVENVLSLTSDDQIKRIVEVAKDDGASESAIADALKTAKAVTMDSSTRCGAEGDWTEQAGYFVARAAVAAMTPQAQSRSSGPAWQAAMSCRMARTSILINDDCDDMPEHSENESQYDILSNYLNS